VIEAALGHADISLTHLRANIPVWDGPGEIVEVTASKVLPYAIEGRDESAAIGTLHTR
jgi:hypothetical protein